MNLTPLVLEAFSKDTECIIERIDFDSEESKEILSLLNVEIAMGEQYVLTVDAAEQVKKIRNVTGIPSESEVILRRRIFTDDLPYLVHTNRELDMMLSGKKPLAVFCDTYPAECYFAPENKFEPYIKAGRFVKRVAISELQGGTALRWTLFAQSVEAWRIDAYLLLQEVAATIGWSNSLVWLEGSLLGYTNEENSLYLAAREKLQLG
jgi:hypothetical protein